MTIDGVTSVSIIDFRHRLAESTIDCHTFTGPVVIPSSWTTRLA